MLLKPKEVHSKADHMQNGQNNDYQYKFTR